MWELKIIFILTARFYDVWNSSYRENTIVESHFGAKTFLLFQKVKKYALKYYDRFNTIDYFKLVLTIQYNNRNTS